MSADLSAGGGQPQQEALTEPEATRSTETPVGAVGAVRRKPGSLGAGSGGPTTTPAAREKLFAAYQDALRLGGAVRWARLVDALFFERDALVGALERAEQRAALAEPNGPMAAERANPASSAQALGSASAAAAKLREIVGLLVNATPQNDAIDEVERLALWQVDLMEAAIEEARLEWPASVRHFRARAERAEQALTLAADTFGDLVQGLTLLGHDTTAAACAIAEHAARAVLAGTPDTPPAPTEYAFEECGPELEAPGEASGAPDGEETL